MATLYYKIVYIVLYYDVLWVNYSPMCVCVCPQQEMLLTEEKAIKAYLSDGDPLSPQILDTVVKPYWKQEPYK